jgi:hypothetical protein
MKGNSSLFKANLDSLKLKLDNQILANKNS